MATQFAPLSEAPPTPLATPAVQSAWSGQSVQSTPALQAFGLRSHEDETAGSWKLAGGHAVTLQDAHAAVLCITHGRVWATLDGPHTGPANQQGDMVLEAGQRLTVPAGRRVVMEPWRSSGAGAASGSAAANGSDAVYFSWDPVPALLPQQTPGAEPDASRWQLAVVCPLRDLGLALVQAARALGRLAWGVASLLADVGEALTAGRGRVQPCMESNPP